MSNIWDYMKPAVAKPEPVKIEVSEQRVLTIGWSDGATSRLEARRLRQQCPCAACVDEWSHVRTLAPETVPVDITLRETSPVGNYALQLAFSDAHATGIYTWVLLRELGTPAAT